MAEIELKFQIPELRREAVGRAVAARAAQTVRLQAQYFDTADRRLAAAGLALRLRQEDGRWTQAVKGRGDGALRRLEHEVVVHTRRRPPQLDLERHAGTPAGAALAAALGDAPALALQPSYETDVRRTRRLLRSGNSTVELALDTGTIRARAGELPVCELELELKDGPLDGLLTLAASWVERHALWLDVRSKAERGDRLARGEAGGPVVLAGMPALRRDMGADAALRVIVGSCLEQILPNAAEVAAGSGTPPHLHQARVGLRRLRSALRSFGTWSPAVDADWLPAMARLFAQLGRARDLDTLASLWPRLQAAGAPEVSLPAGSARDDAAQALRAPHVVRLLLQLIGFAYGEPRGHEAGTRGKPTKLDHLARARIVRLHHRISQDAAMFIGLDDTERHRARKRLKRLRYCVEMVASLFPKKPVNRYLARLRPAQEALGQYSDLQVAQATFLGALEHDARAWFALGWLAANRSPLLHDAAHALSRLPKAPTFLRRD